MNRKTTIILFYSAIALFAVAIVGLSMFARKRMPSSQANADIVVDSGREVAEGWFPIQKDLSAVNQDNQPVKLSDLRGKVWLVAEFFAVCPMCAVRNGSELRAIYDEFKRHPDFHIACISVDPQTDQPEKLADYAKALGAESKNWWFLNAGDAKATHLYLERELKFFGIKERRDPADIETNGRYLHDLGFILVDRDFNVIKKWPLAEARSEEAEKREPGLYDRMKKDLFARIRAELDKNESPGI